jgi:hypothetical protein
MKRRFSRCKTFNQCEKNLPVVYFLCIPIYQESLSGLSYKLKKIDGVDDGIFFIPKEDTNKRVRLAAIHTHIENILIKYPRMRRQSF